MSDATVPDHTVPNHTVPNHTVSTRFGELAEQTRRIEDLITAELRHDRAALEMGKATLRARASSADARIAEAADGLGQRWRSVRDTIDRHFADRRSAAAERRAERDLDKAERRADAAEQDAADALNLALYVLEQAEWAVVDAALARADAHDLAAMQRREA